MRVLVTGATGFVGSHTTRRLLAEGHELRVLVRDPAKFVDLMGRMDVDATAVEVVRGDITDAAGVRDAVHGCDAVVHAAAVVATDPTMEAAMEATNLAGTTNVIDAATDAGCDPVVYVSSVAALFPFQTDPVTAEHPVMGNDEAYGRTKAACERFVRGRQDEGVPIVTIYPSGIIGPDDWTGSINLSSVILWLEKGFPMARNISGSYVDVRDLAELVAAALHPGGGPRRYLAMGTYATAAELVAAIEEATGARVRTLPTPQVVMWAWGRLGDVARRFGRDIVMTSDGYDYLFHSRPGDDSPTTEATGVVFRPLVDTFRDTFRWLHRAGKVDPSKVGVLARDP